jgi:hypothetical protein
VLLESLSLESPALLRPLPSSSSPASLGDTFFEAATWSRFHETVSAENFVQNLSL